MEIRKPTSSELEEIIKLTPLSMREGTMGNAEPSPEKIQKIFAPLLEKGCYYQIATEDEQLMGWVLIGPNQDQMTDEVVGFIYELYVVREFRGRGISKPLMQTAIENLKVDGYREVRLSVYAGNHAMQLYEKLGFSVRASSMSLSF